MGDSRAFDVKQEKFLTATSAVDDAARSIEFVISTESVDSDGDVISVDGWDLTRYSKNPVVLWAHDHSKPPIARADNVRVEGRTLVATATFPAAGVYQFADTVFELYKGGFLNAVSVGFRAHAAEPLINGDGDVTGFKFTKQELHEFSACPVPANPDALVRAKSAGLDTSDCVAWLGDLLDRGVGDRDKLSAAWTHAKGSVHPAIQQELAERNASVVLAREQRDLAALGAETRSNPAPSASRADSAAVGDPEASAAAGATPAAHSTKEAKLGDRFTSLPAEDGHTHDFAAGDTSTEPSGADEHVHAVTYAGGHITLELEDGHTHPVPDGATYTPKESEVPALEQPKALTQFPEAGDDMPVLLKNSSYTRFPVAEAEALREDFPALWGEDDGFLDKVKAGDADTLRAREVWAAKNVHRTDVAGVLDQMRHLVVGAYGIAHMRAQVAAAKIAEADKVAAAQEDVTKDAELSAFIVETVNAVVQGTIAKIRNSRG